ncbi:hypothetical protein ACHAQH_004245 [Verticillium albo-atrum]
MPILTKAMVPAVQLTKTITTRAEESSSLPYTPPIPSPDANFIPLYVLLGLVPLTFLTIGLWACHLERKADRAQARDDVELQTLRTHWFPWREAIDISSPPTAASRTTTVQDAAADADGPVAQNLHPEIATNQYLSSRFSLDESPTPAVKRGKDHAKNDTHAQGANRLLSRLRAGEAAATLPTTVNDWHAVHAALLPHRFGVARKPVAAKVDMTVGAPLPGDPASPTISAPSFIGSTVSIVGLSEPGCGRGERLSVADGDVSVVDEGSGEEECDGKGKGRAGVKVTSKPILTKTQNGDMF